MVKTLKDHQIFAIECMNYSPQLGIFYQPGCGKTAIALTWLLESLKKGLIKDALVICPASLVPNWAKDIDDFTDFDHVTAEDVKLLQEKVTIRSFQKTYATLKHTVHHRDGTEEVIRRRKLSPDVDKFWGAIIIDESQSIGRHDSQQTKTALTLSHLTHYRYLLSGTPISGSTKAGADYAKMYGQMLFLHPGLWNNWGEFCGKYVEKRGYFKQIEKYREEPLKKLLDDNSISMRLEDCCDLPEITETWIPCPLVEKKIYYDMMYARTEKYPLDFKAGGVQFTKMLQTCSGHLKTDDGLWTLKTSKDQALTDILTGTDDSVVVFCTYTASVDRCYEVAKKAGRNPVIFDGRSTTATWKDFQDGTYDTIILQWQAGGAGLNLQISHTLVVYEPTFTSEKWEQGRDRIKRINQKHKMRYIYLYTPDTNEEFVYANVSCGITITDELIFGWLDQHM